MDTKTKNPETEKAAAEKAAAKAAEKAARETVRNAESDFRAAEKNLRAGERLKHNARKGIVWLAKARATHRLPIGFARMLVARVDDIVAHVDPANAKAVRAAVKAYGEELEKADPKARTFKTPSKGVINAIAKINAETWARVDTMAAESDRAAEVAAAAWDAFGTL